MTKQTDKDLIKSLAKWIDRVGRNEAMANLCRKGVGTSTAERLVHGRYTSRPGSILKTVIAELLTEQEERAS